MIIDFAAKSDISSKEKGMFEGMLAVQVKSQEHMPISEKPAVKGRKIVLVALLLSVCVSVAQSSYCRTPSEWMLKQNEESAGDCLVYVSHDAVKVTASRLGCDLIVKAPDWKVHCFRSVEKIEWVGGLKDFSGMIMANPFAVIKPTKTLALTEIGTGDFKGLSLTKFKTAISRRDLLYSCSEIPVAPQIVDFLSKLYGVPNSNQIPLYRVCDKGALKNNSPTTSGPMDIDASNDLRSGSTVKLKTKSWNKVSYAASDFEVPKGLKRVPDIIRVCYSNKKKDELTEIFGEVGFKTKDKTQSLKK